MTQLRIEALLWGKSLVTIADLLTGTVRQQRALRARRRGGPAHKYACLGWLFACYQHKFELRTPRDT